ncbi:uroporphyrinogen-III synthase [Lentisphaera profundi]|uniref:Uroporphyrinogen-III synthase n=1 Tax=Lentisphaera profundi TaxID=1658616 RepID=A0ABY7VUW6_9BACT|nr:uroporphyrinogen-III synthase [Lentisphaera profundi]WDE98016.1 uroporphyrinogen-III synthase [Lentisphaera profundi]
MRVLLTGFPDTNKKAKKTLEHYSGVALDFPLQKMKIIDGSIKLLGKSDWVIFTSPAAVRLYMQHLYPLNHFIKAACVGPATAGALEEDYGRACSLVPAKNYSAKALAEEIINNLSLFRAKKILFPCSRLAKDDLMRELSEVGLDVTRHNFYEPEQSQAGVLPHFDAVCFFSSSAVEAYFSLSDPADLALKKVSLIGESTAITFRQYSNADFLVANQPSAEEAVKVLFS